MREINPQRMHELEAAARAVAHMIADRLGALVPSEKPGFALLVFSFDGPELTWISNAERGDMLKALGEFMDKAEADRLDELSRPKGSG